MSPTVAGVLLAAGRGSRLGQPKATVRLGDERLVDRGVRVLRDAGCDPVYVVTGAAADVDVPGAHRVHNPDWATGMGSSVRVGLCALPDSVPAAVLALVDQPFVTSAAVARLCRAFHAGAEIAVASYNGAPRNPVLLARTHWPAIRTAMTGDVGARAFLRAHPELVTEVECADIADPSDIDTEEDLARARAVVNG